MVFEVMGEFSYVKYVGSVSAIFELTEVILLNYLLAQYYIVQIKLEAEILRYTLYELISK